MRILLLRSILALSASAILVGVASPAAAQSAQGHPYQQVISANPFGLLLELFNAEYERIVTESSTAGIGGSTFSRSDDRYVNVDAFWRFYPSGVPLDGWAFGSKVGLTSVTDEGTYFGFGFDVNRSWLMGAQDNFYVGLGFGLKRIIGSPDEVSLKFIPTFRIVNVGFAF
ncbi:MAG: hypothetical protein EA350_04265 [Gemmatimonadales bacterium]|nr:MAG: hypothetical protein EA350_04265 [Gemmatimonadales bacterium]